MFSDQTPDPQLNSQQSQSPKTSIRDSVTADLQMLSQVLPELQKDLERYSKTGVPVITDDEDLLGTSIWYQDANTLHAMIPNDTYGSIRIRVSTSVQGDTNIFLRSGSISSDFYSLSVDMKQGEDSELMLPSGNSLKPSSDWPFAESVIKDLSRSVARIADTLGRNDLSARL